MPLKSPIRWVGGKYRLRKKITNMLPDQDSYTCYVEVFGGAGWVLFEKEPSPVEIFNDIDNELINFFIVLKDRRSELIHKIQEFPIVSRSFFDQLNRQDPIALNNIDRAYRFYYLLMAGWGGEWENPRFQTSIADFGKGNRMFGALRNLRSRLTQASERISEVIIENLDWRECIERYDDNRTVMFLDPPYPGNSCNYFHNMLNAEEHRDLANRLFKANCHWILTSYDRDDIRSLYSDYNISPVSFASGMDGENGRKNNEIIITNYEIDDNWHNDSENTDESPNINDEVRVDTGQHQGIIGFVQKRNGNLLEIRHPPYASRNTIFVDSAETTILTRFFDRYKLSRKIQTLRKDISSDLSAEILLRLMSLEEVGTISDIPSFVSGSILDRISEIDNR